jgi:hypothetical protein
LTGQTSQDAEKGLTAIETFLDGFRSIALEKERSQEQIFQDFERIRNYLQVLKQATLAEGLVAAPEFNVFRLLGLSRAEVRTHSAMLAHLFKPWEIHGQQFLFLKSFLEYCHMKEPEFPQPSGVMESAHWDVITEYVTVSEGRMDIVVRSPDLGYIVVVENKVDAWERTDQMKRYGRWLESQLRDYPTQGLIFLTLQGYQAYTAQGVPYLPLSYHDDISSWLAGILDNIQAQNVRTVISQYVVLARNL